MNTIKYIFLAMSIVFFFSCDKDDDVNKPDQVGLVELQFPLNNETVIDTQPKFEWKAFETDKTITYTVLTGTETNNLSMLKTNIDELFTTVNDEELLETATDYYWKVQAFENNKLVAESTAQKFTTETISPTTIVENANYSKRKAAGIAVFKDKIWVLGGKNEANEDLNDIWSSADGINWTNEGVFPFEPIHSFKLVAFKNKLWIYGGVQDSRIRSFIYSSEDGVNWVKEDEIFPTYQYGIIKMISYKDKLFRLGAYNSNTGDNTSERHVYSSTDGLNWNLETENHGFLSKYSFKITEFNNLMYCFDFDRQASTTIIKSSIDGINWQEAGSYNYKVSYGSEMFTINNKLILLNPAYNPDKSNGYFEETTDGYNWEAMTSEENRTIPEMSLYELVKLNDKIYAVGGVGSRYNNEVYNDVWKFN